VFSSVLAVPQEHIADLFRRYSAPIIALDLVKQHEKRPRESMVGSMYRQAIEVVNESLPVEHKVSSLSILPEEHHTSRSSDVEHHIVVSKLLVFHKLRGCFIAFAASNPLHASPSDQIRCGTWLWTTAASPPSPRARTSPTRAAGESHTGPHSPVFDFVFVLIKYGPRCPQ
jgi:hypothetical protein